MLVSLVSRTCKSRLSSLDGSPRSFVTAKIWQMLSVHLVLCHGGISPYYLDARLPRTPLSIWPPQVRRPSSNPEHWDCPSGQQHHSTTLDTDIVLLMCWVEWNCWEWSSALWGGLPWTCTSLSAVVETWPWHADRPVSILHSLNGPVQRTTGQSQWEHPITCWSLPL